ncbi:MAG: hypothetical protein HUU06_02665 [Planctomycetaceae bacterium]|nr:hypothetical protein [Planctomycetaceae bacterium]
MKSLRTGVSAVEFIVFTAMSLFLITAGYGLLRSGARVGSNTEVGLNLQQGVRNLMENLVKDVNASVFIAEPHGQTQLPAKKIVVWVFDDEKEAGDDSIVLPGKRLDLNGGPDGPGLVGQRNPYPFYHNDVPTVWGIPVVQVTYEWRENEKVVTRKAERGAVKVENVQKGKPFVERLSFTARGGVVNPTANSTRKMADNVTQFESFPFGYNELKRDDTNKMGTLLPTSELPDIVTGMGSSVTPVHAGFTGFGGGGSGGAQGTTPRIARTAMLIVKTKAVYDYVDTKVRDQEVFMATKIWSYAKIYEHAYAPYFSSIDDDLRF